jgi:solute:Na+ symporter, SSS family
LISLFISLVYLIKGGFRSNVFVDVFQFFVMFLGFILILIFSGVKFGGMDFISASVPETHLKITGGMSPTFLIVWFLIALWTFADPGFHQRSYAAKTGNIAKWGIIISIFFFALFDFLTTSTGLFAKSVLPNLDNPVLAFPLFAEKVLPTGIKGIFYAALFATILSTQISFLFLSGTTIGRDFIFRLSKSQNENKLKNYTIIGLIVSGIIAVILAYSIPSVIEIWYTIGSMFIPGIILPVISAYYPKLRVSNKIILMEMITAVLSSVAWYFVRDYFSNIYLVNEIEPMLVGLFFAVIIHFGYLIKNRSDLL